MIPISLVPEQKPVFGWLAEEQSSQNCPYTRRKARRDAHAYKFETGVYSCTWGHCYNLANFCSNAV